MGAGYLGPKRLPTGVLALCSLLLLANILYFIVLSISVGQYNGRCLLASVLVFAVAAGSVWIPLRGTHRAYGAIVIAVFAVLGLQSLLMWRIPTLGLLRYCAGAEIFFIGNMAIATFCGMVACLILARKGRRRILLTALIAVTLLQFIVNAWLMMYRDPEMDVWFFHHDAVTALASGHNPYEITYANIFNTDGKDDSPYYSREVQRDGRLLFGYPYPPLCLLLLHPSELLTQDSRYALVLYYLCAAVLIGLLDCGGGIAISSAAILLLAPSCWLVFRDAWTEPELILALIVVVWCGIRRSPWLPVVLGLFFALKQYTPIFFPLLFLILPRPLSWKTSAKFFGILLGTTAVVTLPLALWNWPAFWHSAVYIQMIQPFRYDAFSFLAFYARSLPPGQAPPSAAIAFLVLIPVEAVLLWKLPRNMAGFTLGVGVTMIFFLFFNRQSFLNYHTFAGAALLIAAATFERLYAVDSGEIEQRQLQP